MNFGHPVVWIAPVLYDTQRMFVCVVHSAQGDIYQTSDLADGAASRWVRLASPPGTQGHPFNVHALRDSATGAAKTLPRWLRLQRDFKRAGRLSPKRVRLLETIPGFRWEQTPKA